MKHLHALEAFDEVKEYAVKHSLYREALELYKYQAEQLKEMTRLYADYLYGQSNYQEAAIGKTRPISKLSPYVLIPLLQLTSLLVFMMRRTNVTKLPTAGVNLFTAL